MPGDLSAELALALELSTIDATLHQRLVGAGFDSQLFLELAATLREEPDPLVRRRKRNVLQGLIRAPEPGEIAPCALANTANYERYSALGEQALARGELAFCTLAGGMATRMGGIVKALAHAVDGHSFLSMRLHENDSASDRAGHAVPLWLMTSEATHAPIVQALENSRAGEHVAAFRQNLSLRLNAEGTLFRDSAGRPSEYATGHGDVVDALLRAQLIQRFVARGGKYVWITNVDNLGASIDASILGQFIEATERGFEVQCEVCRKEGDRGGIPVRVNGTLQIVEEFRLPEHFDAETVTVFNTNTFLVSAQALLRSALSWTYFEVEKLVDGRKAIQFERLMQELTSSLNTTYVQVARDGARSRFVPVKDFDELARRRTTIVAIARSRGML